ncbi:cytochrome P450 [Favolaschia claudopus]|uniref:Cytochrome P450 n=1 Tax=Favolaschia claudopus TaxID=2862362 RepID=A0AAW0D1Q4_9AGAR
MLESFQRLVPYNLEVGSAALAILATFLGLHALRRLVSLVRIARTPSPFPKLYTPFQPFTVPGALISTSFWNHGPDWHWVRRFQTYHQNETVNLVPILAGVPGLWTSSIEIGRQTIPGSQRSSFVKPDRLSLALLAWGMNIVSADGAVHRKHRRIVSPSFGPELYQLVWTKTAEFYRDMLEVEGWNHKNSVDVPAVTNITTKVAFLLISTCGFGFPSTWDTPPTAPDGGMSIQEALKIVTQTSVVDVVIPKWLWYLPIPSLREARIARERLHAFMKEQVADRKAAVAAETKDTRTDIFTLMVKANEDESAKYQLEDQELIGNIFVLLFAGHETTANSLAVTLAFMAIDVNLQNEVLRQITSVLGSRHELQYDDYPKLDKVLACFYEAIRIVPAGHVLIREATEDTVITVPNPVGEEGTQAIPIAKGTEIMVDMVGVQYNPRYFKDPTVYKPSRWYGLPPESEQFTAFSVGPRACLGRKFATVEATCFLSHLLKDWQVQPVLLPGESNEAWIARIINKSRVSLTLTIGEFPLRFVRRQPA